MMQAQTHDGPCYRNTLLAQLLAEFAKDIVEEALRPRFVNEPIQHSAPLPRPVPVAMSVNAPAAVLALLGPASGAAVPSDVA
jgi:hypothetical protein